jgi:hypothetical protein
MRIFYLMLLIFATNFKLIAFQISFVQTIKDSDSSITFKLHTSFKLGERWTSQNIIDSIRFYNPDTDSLFSFPIFDWNNVNPIYYEATFTFNPLDPQFAFFNRADSLLVFFQTFKYPINVMADGKMDYFMQSIYRSTFNYNQNNIIYFTKVFPKNLKKIKSNSSLSIKNIYYHSKYLKGGDFYESNMKNYMTSSATFFTSIYHTVPYFEIDGDSLVFETINPTDSFFHNLSFSESIHQPLTDTAIVGKYHSRFNKNFLTYLNCPRNQVNCSPDPTSYPPVGQFFNSKTGEYIIGKKDTSFTNNRNPNWRIFMFNKCIEYNIKNNSKDKLYETYFTHHFDVTHSHNNNNYLQSVPRINASRYEWTVCASDTLDFDIPLTVVNNRSGNNRQSNIYWDTGIADAQLRILPDFFTGERGKFTWMPDSSHIRSQPYRFHVFTELDTFDVNIINYNTHYGFDLRYFMPQRNGRAFLIKVIAPIRSRTVIDSVQCGRVYVHAADTLPTEVRFTHRWQLLTLDKDSLVALSWGRNSSIQAPKGGRYLLELMVISEQNTCPYIQYDTVDIPDFLRLEMEDFDICKGKDLFYATNVKNAQGNINYQWSYLNQSSTLPLIVRAAVDTSFQVFLTVSDTLGCSATDSTLIKVLTLPEFLLREDSIICLGDEIPIQSPITAPNYLWSNGDTTRSTFIGGGTHFLTVTDSVGCQFTDSISLLEQIAVIPQYSWNQVLCQGDSLRLEVADFPATVSNFLISYAGQTYNSRSITLPPSLDSNEILRFTFTVNEHGIQCVQHWDDTLNLLPKAELTVALPDTLCSADLPFVPNVSHSGIAFQSSWDGSGIAPTYNTTANQGYYGPFEMSAFAISAEGCTTHFFQPLTVAHLDEVAITAPSDYCIVLPSTLELPTTSAMGNDIQWSSNGSGTFTNNVYRFATQDTAQSTLVFYAQTGQFSPCPLAVDSAEMAVYPQPQALFTANPQSGCNPLEVNVSAQNIGHQNYDWLLYGVRENSGQTATLTFDRSGMYPLQLAIRHFNCVDTSNAVEINVYPVPQVEISFNPEEIYGGNTPVEFFVKNYDASATYTWFVNDVEVSKERRFTTSLGDTGFHQVRVEIRSKDGCLNEAVLEIFVHREAFIIFPNAFYPGTQNFNKNEAFRPVTYGIADWEIEVFAPRMGQKLYEGKNQAWDGGSHPQGTYMFIARYTTLSGEKGEMSGTVHLLR